MNYVRLNLNECDMEYQSARIYVATYSTMDDVYKRIEDKFQISNFKLFAGLNYLPRFEGIHILKDKELIDVFPWRQQNRHDRAAGTGDHPPIPKLKILGGKIVKPSDSQTIDTVGAAPATSAPAPEVQFVKPKPIGSAPTSGDRTGPSDSKMDSAKDQPASSGVSLTITKPQKKTKKKGKGKERETDQVGETSDSQTTDVASTASASDVSDVVPSTSTSVREVEFANPQPIGSSPTSGDRTGPSDSRMDSAKDQPASSGVSLAIRQPQKKTEKKCKGKERGTDQVGETSDSQTTDVASTASASDVSDVALSTPAGETQLAERQYTATRYGPAQRYSSHHPTRDCGFSAGGARGDFDGGLRGGLTTGLRQVRPPRDRRRARSARVPRRSRSAEGLGGSPTAASSIQHVEPERAATASASIGPAENASSSERDHSADKFTKHQRWRMVEKE